MGQRKYKFTIEKASGWLQVVFVFSMGNGERHQKSTLNKLTKKGRKEEFFIYRVIFFNWASPENVSRLAPPKNALTGPPHFEKVLSMAAERGEIPNSLTFLIPRGGQSGTLTFF